MDALHIQIPKYYKVKENQTLSDIARAFGVAERAIVSLNRLTGEPKEGEIIEIPAPSGNAYVVKAGDTKTLLCGSEENYREKNGTDIMYLGMRVIL